jgi:hypothetical protein
MVLQMSLSHSAQMLLRLHLKVTEVVEVTFFCSKIFFNTHPSF